MICNHQLAVRFCQGAPVLGVCQLTIFMFDTNKELFWWPWTLSLQDTVVTSPKQLQNFWENLHIVPHENMFNQRAFYCNSRFDTKTVDVCDQIKRTLNYTPSVNKISLKDYQTYALEKFDRQMRSIVEHANTDNIWLAMSGGIDSTMCAAWLYHNKINFTGFSMINVHVDGYYNKLTYEITAKKICDTLGIPFEYVDVSSEYNDGINPITDYCSADNYAIPQTNHHVEATWTLQSVNSRSKNYDGACIIEANGGDNLFLHNQCTWDRMIPKTHAKFLENNNFPYSMLNNYDYLNGRYSDTWKKYAKLANCDHGQHQLFSPALEHNIGPSLTKDELYNCTYTPFLNKEWYDMWHSIQFDDINYDTWFDLTDVQWLKKQIAYYTSNEIADTVKHFPCVETFYTPGEFNHNWFMNEFKKFIDIFAESKHVYISLYWTMASEVLHNYKKISPDTMQRLHATNWYLKHGKSKF